MSELNTFSRFEVGERVTVSRRTSVHHGKSGTVAETKGNIAYVKIDGKDDVVPFGDRAITPETTGKGHPETKLKFNEGDIVQVIWGNLYKRGAIGIVQRTDGQYVSVNTQTSPNKPAEPIFARDHELDLLMRRPPLLANAKSLNAYLEIN